MNSNAGSVLFKYGGTTKLHGGVLFKYRGTAMLEVCNSNTDEQQRWNCVIQILRNTNAGRVLFKYIGTTRLHGDLLFKFRRTAMLELCYSYTEEQQHWNCVIQIQRNSNAGIV